MSVTGISMYFCMFILFVVCISKCSAERLKLHSDSHSVRNKSECKAQFSPEDLSNNCQVYHRKVCQNFDFSSWTKSLLTRMKSTEMAPFQVSVTSYQWKNVDDYVDSAYNITITSLDKSINGFHLIINTVDCESDKYNSCRIFDCRKAEPTKPLVFSYPCYTVLNQRGCHHYQITVAALPQNVAIRYRLNLPDPLRIGNYSNWESTITINEEGFEDRKVEVQFQPAPLQFNVSEYTLHLCDASSGTEKIVDERKILPSDEPKAVFYLKASGHYFVRLVPTFGNTSIRPKTTTYTFIVHGTDEAGVDSGVIYAVAVVAIIAAAVVIVVVVVKHLNKPGKVSDPKPKVLVLYSPDSSEHLKAVYLWSQYLDKHGRCEVLLDTKNMNGNEDPYMWAKRQLGDANHIIFVLSPSSISEMEHALKSEVPSNAKKGEQYLPWRNLIFYCFYLACCDVETHKKMICVAWDSLDHSEYQELNKKMCLKVYHVMSDINKLLCHLHGKNKGSVKCFPCSSKMPDSNYKDNDGDKLQEMLTTITFKSQGDPGKAGINPSPKRYLQQEAV